MGGRSRVRSLSGLGRADYDTSRSSGSVLGSALTRPPNLGRELVAWRNAEATFWASVRGRTDRQAWLRMTKRAPLLPCDSCAQFWS
jgi:hypothetical protein